MPTIEVCFQCCRLGVAIECCVCHARFCHDHFEFHDCAAVSAAIGRVERILRGEREREQGPRRGVTNG